MSGADHLRVVDGARPPSAPPPDPLVGRTIDGRYQIESVLGEGGMGLVYLARHSVLNKRLAIKVLRPDVSNDEEMITRFRQEAQSASAIGNQHIIDISDFGTLPDGATYFVMEFLDGVDLTAAIEEENPMDPGRAIGIAKQLCQALGAAHEAGIVHRDLKPDNIFLISRGGHRDFVKVLDFGIAKVGKGTKRLTKAGQVFGTPHYMSPEQCAGSSVDQRTDVYALGVILYEMVCGRVPFDADNLMGVLTKHMYEQPLAPHELPPPVNVPSSLESVILKCLAKSADQRYQSAAAMLSDLEKTESGVTPDAVIEAVERNSAAGVPSPATQASREAMSVTMGTPPITSRRRGLLGLVAGAVALLLVGVVVIVVSLATSGEDGSRPGLSSVASPPLAPEPPHATGGEQPQVPEDPPDLRDGHSVQEAGSHRTATVTLRTEPAGVEVWRDGELLGNTPIELARPNGSERAELTLRKTRYAEQVVRISSLTAESVLISLDRERRRGGHRGGHASRAGMAVAMEAPTMSAMTHDMAATGGMRTGSGFTSSEVIDPWR